MGQIKIVRTSDRQIFKSCRQKWDFGSKVRMNYEPLQGLKVFEVGTSIHAGMEAGYDPRIYKLLSWSERSALMVAAYVESTKQQMADALLAANEETTPEHLKEDYDERLELGIGMLENYANHYKDNDFYEVLYVEIEFEVEIPGLPGYVYQGRIDAIVRDKNGRIWIVDHKTRGQFGDTEWADMDEQSGSYCWAIQEMLGIKVHGVVFNELLKAAPKPPQVLQSGNLSKNKQWRGTRDYFIKCLAENGQGLSGYEDFIDYLGSRPNPYFRRIQVHRSQRELQLLGERIQLEALDMYDPNVRIYPAPGMFNCMGCSYRVPCLAKMDGSDYQHILDSNFKKRT